MSFSVITDVHCDDCGNWIRGACDLKLNKPKAVREAARNGWLIKKGRHLCPSCRGKDGRGDTLPRPLGH